MNNEIFECIIRIKCKKTTFNKGELVFIHSINEDNYLIVDVNNLKGLSINVNDFNKYFKLTII